MFVNDANMPRQVAAEAIMMKSQKFSCASGQWYIRRRSATRWTSIVLAIVEDGGVGVALNPEDSGRPLAFERAV